LAVWLEPSFEQQRKGQLDLSWQISFKDLLVICFLLNQLYHLPEDMGSIYFDVQFV
jgi:hypothetical protein